MRIVCACTSYWNTREQCEARVNGVWLAETDPLTAAPQYPIHPDYNGLFGLRRWQSMVKRLFSPVDSLIACGSWSEPSFCPLEGVRVLNGGADPSRPHSNGWQYMGCALTALMAHLCNRRDWDVLVFLEADLLVGAVDWDALLREFVARPEEVFGA